jgi:hypothetical protein
MRNEKVPETEEFFCFFGFGKWKFGISLGGPKFYQLSYNLLDFGCWCNSIFLGVGVK